MKIRDSFVGLSNKAKFSFKIFALLVALLYFAFHAINGENGARSYAVIKEEVKDKDARLKKLRREEAQLERNVKLLSNQTLDADMLEERCRIVLNYGFEDETLVDTPTAAE